MEQNIPYLSAMFVLLLLQSHHFLDNPLEDQNVELKEGNRPYEPNESFFFSVSIMIIMHGYFHLQIQSAQQIP